MQQLGPDSTRFHDGGDLTTPPDPSAPPRIVLERTPERPPDEFRLLRRIGYRDRELGELLVPADPATFVTDLTTVPSVFGWLVPRTGVHLPATLLHDGLVHAEGAPDYVSTEGHVIDREQANRVLRDALADSGTALVRRWLMWSAVTVATMVGGRGTRWTAGERLRWRVTALATIVLVAGLGVLATLDWFDVELAGVPGVPWMGAQSWWVELATGAAGAVVIPFVVGLAWGRFRLAGVVLGVALALLLHVTAAVAALTGLYRAAEWLVSRLPWVALVSAGVVLVASVAVFVAALVR